MKSTRKEAIQTTENLTETDVQSIIDQITRIFGILHTDKVIPTDTIVKLCNSRLRVRPTKVETSQKIQPQLRTQMNGTLAQKIIGILMEPDHLEINIVNTNQDVFNQLYSLCYSGYIKNTKPINISEFLKKLKAIKLKKNTAEVIQQVRQETPQYG